MPTRYPRRHRQVRSITQQKLHKGVFPSFPGWPGKGRILMNTGECPMDRRLKQHFFSIIEKFLEVVTMVGFIGMLLATGGQVLFRYALQISVPWTEELARILFIQTMFFGIAIAIRENEHIIVDFLFKKMNRRLQTVGQIAYNTAIFIFLCFLARGTLAMTKMTWGSYMIALDWVRTGYLYMGEFIAIIFMMIYIVMKAYDNLLILRTGEQL